MSSAQPSHAYYVERVAYLTCYVLVIAFALSQLYGDWARKQLKMPVNRHHVRQHWLQLVIGLVSIVENVDPSAAFGIWQPWEVCLLTGIAGSLYGFVLQISAYVLASGHYALVHQNPKWLGPILALVPIIYTIVHTPFLALAGYYGNSVFPFCDGVLTLLAVVVDLTIIDAVFLSIRKVVIATDSIAISTAKILPQLMKIGRIVIATNVVLVIVSVYSVINYPLYSYYIKPVPADGSHPFRGNPVFRLIALAVTMWWAFHWPFPHMKAPVAGMITHHSTPSRPSGRTTRGSISSTSGNSAAPTSTTSTSAAASASASPVPAESAALTADSPHSGTDPSICSAPLECVSVPVLPPPDASPSPSVVVTVDAPTEENHEQS